jgi:ATP-dependent protease ClpP protease subunit
MRQYEIKMQGQVAELSIIGDIDWWNNSSADFTQQFNELRAAGATELRGYINSGGGHMFEANEIYNLIAGFAGRKTCRLGALAASAATTIACAFTDGIEMAANGQYMIHNPTVGATGGPKEMQSAAQLYENLRQVAIDIYVRRTGLPAAEIGAMMDATTWMNATTAKAKGFITAVSGEVAELPGDTAAVLNKYHYAGVPSVVNQALGTPRPASTTAPANRANWTMNDWHANDPAGLQAQMQAHTPLAQQLYKQQYGTDKPAPAGREPQNASAQFAQPVASVPVAPTNRANWTMADWQRNAPEELAAEMKANTPLFQQLHKQAYGREYNAPGSHNKQEKRGW